MPTQILIEHDKPTYAGKMQCQIDKDKVGRRQIPKAKVQKYWKLDFN